MLKEFYGALFCFSLTSYNVLMNISVEYAHIYTHQRINDEHKLSLKVLEETTSNIKKDNNTAIFVVMVDDYSFPDPTFDYKAFVDWLKGQGSEPDLIVRESQLIPACDEVLLKLLKNSKLQQDITEYIQNKKKYPCSLFIAAWYLIRLGYISSSIFPDSLVSETLINILPESFRPFEEKGLEIIKSAGFEAKIKDIHYKFLPGRLIA